VSDALTRFVVVAAPRTGSNWLCTLLDSHPEILCHHELFNPVGIHVAVSQHGRDLGFGSVVEREREPFRLLERAWRLDLGHRAVGFKMNRDQNPSVLRQVLEDRSIRKIVMHRSNRVRTYVSERIAETNGEWESYPWLEIGRMPVTVRVEPRALRQHSRANQRYYEGVHRTLAATGQTAFQVRYEDLDDPPDLTGLLAFLGVSPHVPLQGATRRQNPAPLTTLIENFDELREALRGTELEADLRLTETGARAGAGPA